MNVQAMAVAQDGKALSPHHFELDALRPHEVLIAVSHCGVCRGDLRLFHSQDHSTAKALVPGHEIVGFVVKTGDGVTSHKVGERVGVGWQSGSCRTCESCRRDEPELCPTQEETCIMRPGGYATHVKVQADFAVPIPSAIDSCHAAPLLCGGLAVYSPLKRHNLKPGTNVGIVGIGGLGHLALQVCKALGLHAMAFSTSSDKANDARSLGAEAFIELSDHSAMKKLDNSCDFILSTSAGNVEWRRLLKVLRPGGTLCAVGVASSEIQLPVSELIDERKTITGNPIGSPKMLQDLLQFVSSHSIQPWTEPFRMSDASKVIARLQRGEVRYRAVLEQDLS